MNLVKTILNFLGVFNAIHDLQDKAVMKIEKKHIELNAEYEERLNNLKSKLERANEQKRFEPNVEYEKRLSKLENKSKSTGLKTVGESPREARKNRLLAAVEYGSAGFEKAIHWIVKKLVPKDSVGLLIGEPESFKTFWLIDLACRICLGLPFLGIKVSEGIVVYVAAEGQRGLSLRVKAWEKQNNATLGNKLIRIGVPVNGANDIDFRDIVEVVDLEIKKHDLTVVLFIFDTFSQCSEGIDEIQAGVVAHYINGCRRLATKYESSVLIAHHTSKNSKTLYRGSSALRGNVDYMFGLKRPNLNKNSAELSILKMKEAAKLHKWMMKLKPIQLDTKDEDGDPLESLAVCDYKVLPNSSKEANIDESSSQADQDAQLLRKLLMDSTTERSVQEMIVEFAAYYSLRVDKVKMRVSRAVKALSENEEIVETTIGKEKYLKYRNI